MNDIQNQIVTQASRIVIEARDLTRDRERGILFRQPYGHVVANACHAGAQSLKRCYIGLELLHAQLVPSCCLELLTKPLVKERGGRRKVVLRVKVHRHRAQRKVPAPVASGT